MRKKSYIDYFKEYMDFLKDVGRESQLYRYNNGYNKLMRFTKGCDLSFKDITPELIIRFTEFCKAEGNCKNTISFYVRILRAVYNKAVDAGRALDTKPFRKVFTGNEKTRKRAIPIGKVKELARLDLALKPKLQFARDIFLFSFYTRGMSFVDIARLKKSNLHNGILMYQRSKTGQRLYIRWEKEMSGIYEKYKASPDNPFMFDIMDKGIWERDKYMKKLQTVNEQLKKLGKMLGLRHPLTMYVARHTWASVCREKNVPIRFISEGLGHDNEMTTQIYLAQIETNEMDKINHKIIGLLK